MIFLLDTNAFSDLMREHSKVHENLSNISSTDRVIICPIVRGEILYGIERLGIGRRRSELGSKASHLFASISCEPIPASAGDHYANIKQTRQENGLTMDENDLWIAATTLALEAVLISRDNDFQKVENLTINDWTV